MGAFLQAILQGAGRAGNEYSEAKTANLEQQRKLQQFKMQMQELQNRLGQQPIENQIKTAPQVVGSYKGAGGKYVSVLRDPVSGKVSYQESTGPKELSPEEEKVQSLRGILGREPTEDEKKMMVGAEGKTNKAPYTAIRPDAKGKMWGLNPETKQWEPIPEIPGTSFKAPTKGPAGVDPIIRAQIGSPPDASVYPQGEDDPIYKAKAKLWGTQAETIKNRMVAQRGIGYNMSRIGPYVTPEGELVSATGAQALSGGYVPASPAFNAMSKQAQFSEMQSASGKLRGAINALEPSDAFSSDQVAKLKLASESQDPGVFTAVVTNLASGSTNERQQDYLIWLAQMGERILSLRNVAGMGQGAQDLRAAIQATLPNISSGTKAFALKRLDAVDNQINLLQKGIPKVSKITGNAASGGSNVIVVSPEDMK